MGKERDKLIKQYSGTPFSETGKTIRQAGMEAIARSLGRGEVPEQFSGPVEPAYDPTAGAPDNVTDAQKAKSDKKD